MTGAAQTTPHPLVLDAMCLNHFARVDRLDVLRELLIGDQCSTTYVAITDDQSAARVARTFGLEVHGTVWLLGRACRDGKLTVTAASNLVEMLRATDMRLPCTGPEFETWARQRGLL